MRILTALLLLSASASVMAGDYNPLETVDQARQRQSAENYDKYQRSRESGNLLPPTYEQPLGSPTVRGVERPGYTAPTYDKPRDWRDAAKR